MADEWDVIQQALRQVFEQIEDVCRGHSDQLSGRDMTLVTRLHGHESELAHDVSALRRCLS